MATELSRLADLYMLWSDVQQDLIDHLEAHLYEMRWPCDLGWARRADVLIDVLSVNSKARLDKKVDLETARS